MKRPPQSMFSATFFCDAMVWWEGEREGSEGRVQLGVWMFVDRCQSMTVARSKKLYARRIGGAGVIGALVWRVARAVPKAEKMGAPLWKHPITRRGRDRLPCLVSIFITFIHFSKTTGSQLDTDIGRMMLQHRLSY